MIRHLATALAAALLAACATPPSTVYLERELEATQPAAELESNFNSEMRVTSHTLVLQNDGVRDRGEPAAIVRLDGAPTSTVPVAIDTVLVVFGGPRDPGSWKLHPAEKALTIDRPAHELGAFLTSLRAGETTVRMRGDSTGALFTEIRMQ